MAAGIGERHRIAELVTPRLELAGFPDPAAAAWRLGMLGLGALRARGLATAPMPTGARAFVVIDDAEVPAAPYQPAALDRIRNEATGLFSGAPRLTLAGFLRHHGSRSARPRAGRCTRSTLQGTRWRRGPATTAGCRCSLTGRPAAPRPDDRGAAQAAGRAPPHRRPPPGPWGRAPAPVRVDGRARSPAGGGG